MADYRLNQTIPPTDGQTGVVSGIGPDGKPHILSTDNTGKLNLTGVTITAGDIEIGAVEIKDHTTDNRTAVIDAAPAGTDFGLVTRNIPSGTQAVSAVSLPLPTGASTSAAQTTGNASLTSIDGKLAALGQGVMAGSVPVVIATNQTAVPVSGTVTANAGSGTFSIQATAALPGSVRLSDGAAFYDATKTGQLPTALVGGRLDINIGNDVTATFDHGAKSSISTTALQLIVASTPAVKGVVVKAAAANAGKVFVGNSDVTNGSADATDGLELSAGESATVPVDNANKIWVIGSAASQKVFFMVA